MGTENAKTERLVIVLPTDEARKRQLREKLINYNERKHPHRAPKWQMDLICKIAILERLLRDGAVDTQELSREMAKNYCEGFNADDFENARDVIRDYCETGGQNVSGGKGLIMPG